MIHKITQQQTPTEVVVDDVLPQLREVYKGLTFSMYQSSFETELCESLEWAYDRLAALVGQSTLKKELDL